MAYFDLIRGFHIIAVIAWMAGLLYLPRLYVYHVKATPGSELDETLKVMEQKLLKIIMTPALVLVLFFGLTLVVLDLHRLGVGFWTAPWMITKIVALGGLLSWHGFLAMARRAFAENRNTRSERFWRMSNELPFLLVIIIVLSVTTKFGA